MSTHATREIARHDKYALVRVSDRRWRVIVRDHYADPTIAQVHQFKGAMAENTSTERVPYQEFIFASAPLSREKALQELYRLRELVNQ